MSMTNPRSSTPHSNPALFSEPLHEKPNTTVAERALGVPQHHHSATLHRSDISASSFPMRMATEQCRRSRWRRRPNHGAQIADGQIEVQIRDERMHKTRYSLHRMLKAQSILNLCARRRTFSCYGDVSWLLAFSLHIPGVPDMGKLSMRSSASISGVPGAAAEADGVCQRTRRTSSGSRRTSRR